MEEKKKGIHWGVWIVLTCCCASFTTGQVTTGLVSLFTLPVCSALGCARAEFMLLTTCYAIFYCIGSPVWGKIIQSEKINIRVAMTIGVIICLCGPICYAMGDSLIWFYIGGSCVGFSLAGINGVNFGYFISNWTAGRVRGRVLSINSCMQSVAGMIWPLVVAYFINTMGYKAGYWSVVVIIAVFCLPEAMFLYYRHPEEKGLKPMGYVEDSASAVLDADKKEGMTLKEAFKSPWIYLLFFASFALAFIMGFKSNFSGIAKEGLGLAGYTTQEVQDISTLMLSVLSAVSLVANAAIGITIDKFGQRIGSAMWLIITMLFPIFFIMFGNTPWGLYVGASCFGCHTAIMRTTIPLVVRELFGPKDYSNIFGWINASKGLSSGIGSTIVALVFDLVGSYNGALIFADVIVGIATIIIIAATYKTGKMAWNKRAEEHKAQEA